MPNEQRLFLEQPYRTEWLDCPKNGVVMSTDETKKKPTWAEKHVPTIFGLGVSVLIGVMVVIMRFCT